MKSYTMPLKKLLVQGLRPVNTLEEEGVYLTKSENLVPFASSLRGATKYTRSFILNEQAEIFVTSKGVFVLSKTRLYSYSSGNITIVLEGISEGTRWFCADFGAWIVFSNGTTSIVRNPITGGFSINPSVIPLSITICRFKGRLVVGGVKAGDNPSTSRVEWSDIGKASFNNETSYDLLRKNTAGSREAYEVGNILCVYPFDDLGFIVYGDKSAAIFSPAPQEKAVGAMRYKVLEGLIAASQYAVCLANKAHYVVDTRGVLVKVHIEDNTIVAKELDYREFIETPTSVYTSWNPQDKEFLVGIPPDSPFLLGSSLVLNNYGAGTISSCIQSVKKYGSELIVHAQNRIRQLDCLLTSDILTFDSPGYKMIEQIDIFGDIEESIYIALSYKSAIGEPWLTTDWLPLSSYGTVRPGISGIGFKLHLAVLDYVNIKLDRMTITISYIDKRFRVGARGIYGTQNVT